MRKRRKELNCNSKIQFNEKLELTIYKYLCNEKITWRNWKKIKKEYRFDTYKEWSQYIQKKYIVYSTDSLIEFKKYLENIIRKNSTVSVFGESIVFPGLVSSILTILFNIFADMKYDKEGDLIYIISFSVIMSILLSCLVIYLIKPMLDNVFRNKLRNYMYSDYKDEIEKLIKIREEAQKTTN
ncbi:MAG: hypothetical protein K2M73_10560 [Lachnospiraceae bacterium]|nr:hypothetical protein [Lachnospiraceae bacterium]